MLNGRTTGVGVQNHQRGSLLDRTDKLVDEEILDLVQIGLNPLTIVGLQARAQFNAIEGALAGQSLASIFFSSALLSEDIVLSAGGS